MREAGRRFQTPNCWATAWLQAQALVAEVQALWQGWLDDVARLFPQLQDHSLRASWRTQLRQPLAGSSSARR